jgi:hypothetical protein
LAYNLGRENVQGMIGMEVSSTVPNKARKRPALFRLLLIQLKLNMKTKKSAAVAALKPTEKTSTSSPLIAKSNTVATTSTTSAPSSSAPKAAPSGTKSVSGALTTVDVKVDVGFGNAVYLRGQGSGLTWEQGVPLACVDGTTWRWSQTLSSPVTFKVLINDKVWSAGNDLVIAPGQKLEVAPRFA